MFTGLVVCLGKVTDIEKRPESSLIRIAMPPAALDLRLGDSIAVNGVCLTAVETSSNSFSANVSSETLARTTLSTLEEESMVNLERPLSLNTPLGGHIVQGHVDSRGRIRRISKEKDFYRVQIEFPQSLARYFAEKGSVAVDGVSLTVNSLIGENQLEVMIIPHTWVNTIFQFYHEEDEVNLEVDMFAKYVEKAMDAYLKGQIPNSAEERTASI